MGVMKKTKFVSWHLPLPVLPAVILVLSLILVSSCQTAEPAEDASAPSEKTAVSEQETAEEAAEESEESSDDTYEVSDEVYNRTFSEIEELIDNLNEIIRNEDFEAWKENLTQKYIDTMSSPENLQRISEKPAIKDSGLEVDSLKSYFMNVVVPSRANSRVDEIVFVNDNRIKAFMVINGQKTILYRLVKVDGQWKIGTSD